eukprot:8051836-Pyramimonas_sp.AAC.1
MYGATKRVRGVPIWARWRHANPATGAFGGAPYGATKRCTGCAETETCGGQRQGGEEGGGGRTRE